MPSERPRDRKLSEREVLDVALRLVETSGTDRLSMRRLADELGVTPMAIYRYVHNKEDLLQLLAESVLHQVDHEDNGPWQEVMLANAVKTWQVLNQYPGLATFLLNSPLSEDARRRVEHLVRLLEDAGFDRATAEMAWETYHTYIYGLVALEARFRPSRRDSNARRRTVEFGVRVWLAGLEAQLARNPSA